MAVSRLPGGMFSIDFSLSLADRRCKERGVERHIVKRGGSELCRVRSLAAGLFLTAGFAMSAGAADASDRWEEAGSGAVAILPPPQKARGVASASLFCAEQRWSFFFRLEPGAVPAGWKSPAKITLGGIAFDGEAVEARGSVGMAMPADHLEALKHASRMVFAAVDGTVAAGFSLSGSRAAIDAIATRCSQVDMSAYARVVLSETDPAVETAKILLADEARLFRAETGKQPIHAAATIEPRRRPAVAVCLALRLDQLLRPVGLHAFGLCIGRPGQRMAAGLQQRRRPAPP